MLLIKSVALQVVSGQLEGTMFDTEAAQELLEGSKGKPPLAQRSSGEDSKQAARKAALAARNAARVLQGLPSKVRLSSLLFSEADIKAPFSC